MEETGNVAAPRTASRVDVVLRDVTRAANTQLFIAADSREAIEVGICGRREDPGTSEERVRGGRDGPGSEERRRRVKREIAWGCERGEKEGL